MKVYFELLKEMNDILENFVEGMVVIVEEDNAHGPFFISELNDSNEHQQEEDKGVGKIHTYFGWRESI